MIELDSSINIGIDQILPSIWIFILLLDPCLDFLGHFYHGFSCNEMPLLKFILENSILYPRLHTSHMIPPCYILEFHQFGLPWQQQDLINSFQAYNDGKYSPLRQFLDELVTVKLHGLPTNYDDRPKMIMSVNGK